MSDFEPGRSRHLSRRQKRKQNRLLNLMIIVVVLLIVIVGYSILAGGGGKPEQASQNAATASDTTSKASNQGSGNNKDSAAVGTSDQQKDTSDTGDLKQTDDTATSDGDQQANEQKDPATTENGAPEGPWQPVGTSQEGEHQTSYHRGSQDWNEQMQAVYYATGLSEEDSTLWWIEPDGGPGKTVAYISGKSDPNKFYVVHIEWVDQKGWKPTNVETMNVDDPHAWYEDKKNS